MSQTLEYSQDSYPANHKLWIFSYYQETVAFDEIRINLVCIERTDAPKSDPRLSNRQRILKTEAERQLAKKREYSQNSKFVQAPIVKTVVAAEVRHLDDYLLCNCGK